MRDRCDPPACVRVLGHDGDHWQTWWGRPLCGAPMPLAGTVCARHVGHKDSHKSRRAMDSDAARQMRWKAA